MSVSNVSIGCVHPTEQKRLMPHARPQMLVTLSHGANLPQEAVVIAALYIWLFWSTECVQLGRQVRPGIPPQSL